MQALSSARTRILAGEADIVLVAGVESMSNAPYVLGTARWGQRLNHGERTDTIRDLLYSGSGIGMGHPVGCTGIRLVVSLLHEMRRRGERFGLATLCVGGGMGMSTLLEFEG